MDEIAGIFFRWLHMTAVGIVVGGFFLVRLGAGQARRYRPWMLAAVAALLVSGLYNLLTKDVFPPGYHMWFGIKALLALHIVAVAFIATKDSLDESRRSRLASGIVISGVSIYAISSYLRWLSLHP